MKKFLICLAGIGFSAAAAAADLPVKKGAPKAVEAPSAACLEKNSLSTDVFGFNTGSDINDYQAFTASLQYNGNFGTRAGSLNGHLGTAQLNYSPYPCLETDPYVFAGVINSKSFGVKTSGSLVGGGIELKYKFLGRDTHGVGLTLDFVQQAAATSGGFYTVVGRSRDVHDTIISLFADKELISGKLYGALNFGYDFNWRDQGSPRNGYLNTSTARFGGALSYQVVDGVFVGGEANHYRQYNNLFFGREAGYATFVGPTFFWQVTKAVAVSGAWNVQVDGRATGTRSKLDLTNFNHHLVKVKLGYTF